MIRRTTARACPIDHDAGPVLHVTARPDNRDDLTPIAALFGVV
ncbi:hypothetical protein BH20ACT6_BH20ACT6_11890 [soil metagenome]